MTYDRPMFATLGGAYPATDPGDVVDRDVESLVRRVLDDQREAGLGLLTDGGVRTDDAGRDDPRPAGRPGAGPSVAAR